MTFDETAAILGPEITARLDTAAATWPPLTPAQIAEIAPCCSTTCHGPNPLVNGNCFRLVPEGQVCSQDCCNATRSGDDLRSPQHQPGCRPAP